MSQTQEIRIEEFVTHIWRQMEPDTLRVFGNGPIFDPYTHFACTLQDVAGQRYFVANRHGAGKTFCHCVDQGEADGYKKLTEAFKNYLKEFGYKDVLWYDLEKNATIPPRKSWLVMCNTTFANHLFTFADRSKFEFRRSLQDEEIFVLRRLTLCGRTVLVCNSSQGAKEFKAELLPENRTLIYRQFLAYMQQHGFEHVCVCCN